MNNLFPNTWPLEELLNSPLEIKRSVLESWNESYRKGEPQVGDQSYDRLLETLPEDDRLRQKVGFEVDDGQRKVRLPVPMFSMDKVKSMEEIKKWMESKSIAPNEQVVITPKYDGLSFLVNGKTLQAYTRGNGTEGQRSDAHFQKLLNGRRFEVPKILQDRHLIGEVIMPRAVFEEKYSEDYRNPRNLVAGLFNNKEPQPALADVNFMVYGVSEGEEGKSEILTWLNPLNAVQVPFRRLSLEDLTEELLQASFAEWNLEHEIDGLIVELDDAERRLELGREKNNNPCFARAWKGFEALSASTTIRGIQYQVSKDGRLTMVGQLDPIELDGVTVSNVTLNNAGMMLERGWGIGAKVKVIRSGMVIPKIVGTDDPVAPSLPETCPTCEAELKWNSTRVHLMCRNSECSAQQIQGAISFFKVMEIDEVGEKIVEQLFEAGYNSVEKILNMSVADFLALERFAEKRAQLIHDNIHGKCQKVPLERLQHASGCFDGMGTKRLALVSRYDSENNTPDFETLLTIDGFSDVTARAYLKGIGPFWAWASKLPITIAATKLVDENATGPCSGMKFCFTGYRDKAAQAKIEELGGQVVSGVSGKTTHVVTKDANGSSSKLKKARGLGIEIWEPEQLNRFLA